MMRRFRGMPEMYITRFAMRNVRVVKELDIELADDECAGWHVILGANGAGKSSVIRSIALALIGSREATALRQNWSTWLRHSEAEGSIDIDIIPDRDKDDLVGTPFAPGQKSRRDSARLSIRFKRQSR